jgi:hypothetical protein
MNSDEKKKLNIFKASISLFLYCLPAILAVIVIIGYNMNRVNYAAGRIWEYVEHKNKQGKEFKFHEDPEMKKVEKKLHEFLNKQAALGKLEALTEKKIKKRINTTWLINSMYVLVLTLLPFVILGSGFVYKTEYHESFSKTLLRILKESPMRYMVGFVICFGWMYFFNPFGVGASAIHSYLQYADIISQSSLPIFVEFPYTVKHSIAGFLGWYLHLLGYFLYKFAKKDVLSSSIYRKLFKNFLFVYGTALMLSSVTGKESLLPLFFVGFFSSSALVILKESFKDKMSGVDVKKTSLSELPGITRWQMVRLEEEEIVSITSLVSSNINRLKGSISGEVISPNMLDYWLDTGKLIIVLGIEKYREIEGLCKTASHFIEKSTDAQFTQQLQEKHQIYNTDEIVKLLKYDYVPGEKRAPVR